MRIVRLGEPEVVMSNPDSKHNYFGWPTVARLQNGKIAVVASGYRIEHVCPFGKAVIAYSEDEGKTYTPPAAVIDTVLDDRDGGIVPFGEKSVMVTSFNNTVEFQRRCTTLPYVLSYLDGVTPDEQNAVLGSTFKISNDCGVTFGPLYKSPVTTPHGPIVLPDGTLLWIGRIFDPADPDRKEKECVQAYKINPDGTSEFVGEIENVACEGYAPLSCEPHAIVLSNGTILAHIRVQAPAHGLFTIFQSESSDGGKTWTKPRQILPDLGGSPPHLFRHSSGMLISTYGYREMPYGIKAMFSSDEGKTWDFGHDVYVNGISADLGYPSTIELEDGSLLTVFYAHLAENQPAVIAQQRWRFERA